MQQHWRLLRRPAVRNKKDGQAHAWGDLPLENELQSPYAPLASLHPASYSLPSAKEEKILNKTPPSSLSGRRPPRAEPLPRGSAELPCPPLDVYMHTSKPPYSQRLARPRRVVAGHRERVRVKPSLVQPVWVAGWFREAREG